MPFTRKHINLTIIMGRHQNNSEYICELVLFVNETPQIMASIEKHLRTKNWYSFNNAANKSKIFSSLLEIKELKRIVTLIEEYLEYEMGSKQMLEKVANIKQICTKVISELKAELKFLPLSNYSKSKNNE